MLFDLAHLTPETAELARRSNKERIGLVWQECWLGYPAAMRSIERLEWLLRLEKRRRMPNMVLLGLTNNGKSTIIKRFISDHPMRTSPDGEYEEASVVYFEIPGPQPARFYGCLLRALNSHRPLTRNLAPLENEALWLLDRCGTRMIIIDEIHNILTGNKDHRRAILNLVRFLGNTLQIPLVIVGTPDAAMVTQADDQTANRFEPFVLPTWTYGEDFLTLLDSFEGVLPLRKSSDLSNPILARKILTMSDGILGEMVTVLSRAAELAIRTGAERITRNTLSEITFTPPSQRRHLVRNAL